MPTNRPLTVAEVSARFSVTKATVLAWIASGELRAINVSRIAHAKRPRWRITEAALTAFEARRAPTPPDVPRRRRPRPTNVIEFYK